MTKTIRFITKNDGKFAELKALLPAEFELVRDSTEIHELQTEDMKALVQDKILKAFQLVRQPLIVDHTGLAFDLMKGFPAGLTSVFYETLRAQGIVDLIGKSVNRNVTVTTMIGYCDGRRKKIFCGKARGKIADQCIGKGGFQWDTIFIPEGYSQTYAELGQAKKNEISMRRRAFDQLVTHLKSCHRD
ncbi:MAG: non-canonical purine NTP pyrophosphatase [Pseudomonadota bacterium]